MAAELLKRYFTTEIQPKLFPDNSFIVRSINDDAWVENDSVQLPHSGANPNVEIDRSILPAPIQKRTDVATEYKMREFTSDPTLITDTEAMVVAYNKRSSVLDQHAKTINNKIAEYALYTWASFATVKVPSTGSARPAGNSNGSQTGTRKAFTVADLLTVRQLFFSSDLQTTNEEVNAIAVLTPRQYSDLLGIAQFTDADKYGSSNIPSGVVKRAFGFDIYVRSRVAVLDNTDALKAMGAAGAATDQDAALFYSPEMVRAARKAAKVYVDNDKPEYYGSIMSAMARFGAAAVRNDAIGIYLLFEDN